MEMDERYQKALSDIENYKRTNDVMNTRLSLKNQEIEQLKNLIKYNQDNCSLQFHTIKAMDKPVLIDPSINHEFSDIRRLLQMTKTDLNNLEIQNAEYLGKPSMRGDKLQSKWKQYSEEAYTGFKEFAEGKIQDFHLVLELEGLRIQEIKGRIEENKEIAENLEKESAGLQSIIIDLQGKYKRSVDQLELLKQEIIRLRRAGN